MHHFFTQIFINDLYGRHVLNPKTIQHVNLSKLKSGKYIFKLKSSSFNNAFTISKI